MRSNQLSYLAISVIGAQIYHFCKFCKHCRKLYAQHRFVLIFKGIHFNYAY